MKTYQIRPADRDITMSLFHDLMESGKSFKYCGKDYDIYEEGSFIITCSEDFISLLSIKHMIISREITD